MNWRGLIDVIEVEYCVYNCCYDIEKLLNLSLPFLPFFHHTQHPPTGPTTHTHLSDLLLLPHQTHLHVQSLTTWGWHIQRDKAGKGRIGRIDENNQQSWTNGCKQNTLSIALCTPPTTCSDHHQRITHVREIRNSIPAFLII